MARHVPMTSDAALEHLVRRSKYEGRSIVPLVGAGISVESGIPNLTMLARYLAKVQHYVGKECYELNYESKKHTKTTHEYLLEFGWPDPQDLDSDLWYWLEEQRGRGNVDPGSYWTKESKHWMAMDLLVQEQIVETLKDLDSRFFTELEKTILSPQRNSLGLPSGMRYWNLTGGYWKELLARASRSNPDLTDALFQKLTGRRLVGTVHRLLAFLTPVLRLRLFFTTNFDTLLEDALRMEGFSPRVFEVSEHASLPHPSLLQDEISIVKLHGGSYGLRVERLNTPLDEETKERFRKSLPMSPILLVLGVGGWDQRVLDMVELVERQDGEILWLHFEDQPPDSVVMRFKGSGAHQHQDTQLITCHSRSPGAFLRELYQEHKDANPTSRFPYRSQEGRPVLKLYHFMPPVKKNDGEEESDSNRTDQDIGPILSSLKKAREMEARPIMAFVDHGAEIGMGCSLRLAEFVAARASTHFPVWINLEVRFNCAEIVLDLFSQLRRYDLGIPPEILPIEVAPFKKLFKRIFSTLRRGRYIIAFNGVGSMGRPPTRHNKADFRYRSPVEDPRSGSLKKVDPSDFRQEDFQTHAEEFLCELVESAVRPRFLEFDNEQKGEPALKDSILAFAIDRTQANEIGDKFLSKLKEKLSQDQQFEQMIGGDLMAGEPLPEPGVTSEELRFDLMSQKGDEELLGRPEEQRAFLILLSAFRRRRSLVTLRYVANRVIRKYIDIAEALGNAKRTLVDECREQAAEKVNSILTITERGNVWMSRSVRDQIYAIASRKLRPILFKIHYEAANYYYNELFLACREVAALMEYFYHQIAALYCWNLLSCEERDLVADQYSHEGWEKVASVGGRSPVRDRLLQSLVNTLAENEQFLLASVAHSSLERWASFIEDCELPLIFEEGNDSPFTKGLKTKICDLLWHLRFEALLDSRHAENLLKVVSNYLLPLIGMRDMKDSNPEVDWAAVSALLANAWDSKGPPYNDPEGSARPLLALRVLIRVATAYRITARYEKALEIILPIMQKFENESRPLGSDAAEALALCKATQAEILLQQLCFWKLKGDSTLSADSDQKRFLEDVQYHLEQSQCAERCCESALRMLAEVLEANLVLRSNIYSALGRAKYLCLDFEGAYRAFDLSKAGLTADGILEREALAIGLLRQCDCLLLHADMEVLQQLAPTELPLNDDQKRGYSESFLRLISLARFGFPKLKAKDVELDALLPMDGDKRGLKKASMLATARSRLALAKDLLERAEAVLEGSRRNVHWWSCLYQLRAQIEVERILLILTGDFRDAPAERGYGPKLIVSQMQSSLRNGLRAVRQGLDILLRPPKIDAEVNEMQREDFQILRFIKLWLQLFACGSMVVPLYVSMKPSWLEGPQSDDYLQKRVNQLKRIKFEAQWQTWVRLNRRAGFSRLTKTQSLRDWFTSKGLLAELEDLGFHLAEGPGLVMRATTLKIMNRLIQQHREQVLDALYQEHD